MQHLLWQDRADFWPRAELSRIMFWWNRSLVPKFNNLMTIRQYFFLKNTARWRMVRRSRNAPRALLKAISLQLDGQDLGHCLLGLQRLAFIFCFLCAPILRNDSMAMGNLWSPHFWNKHQRWRRYVKLLFAPCQCSMLSLSLSFPVFASFFIPIVT